MDSPEQDITENAEDGNASLNHLRLIKPLIVPYKKHIMLALLLLFLGAAANLAIPVAFKQLIDLAKMVATVSVDGLR